MQRIVLETLGVTLSKSARARAMQLPAWNEALGLPRPWDQQWSLRIQQVLAFESDLLEYDDIFEGSVVVEAKTEELAEAATAELADVEALGGAFEAIDELKRRLVRSQAERVRRIESGEQKVVGVNVFTETAPSPLLGDGEFENILKVDHNVEAEQIAEVERWRAERDNVAVRAALDELRRVANDDTPAGNIMAATIALAHAGGTTGNGPVRCARCSASSGRPPASAAGSAGAVTTWRPSACAPGGWPSRPVARPACWWPSRGSTGTPTGPSRSRWRRATPASK